MHGRERQRLESFAVRIVCGAGISLKIIEITILQKNETIDSLTFVYYAK